MVNKTMLRVDLATPLKSVMTLEPFIGGACYIHNSDRQHSSALRIDYDSASGRLNLPQVLAALRAQSRYTPVLMLTARDTLQDKITGFDSGADDYLTKPFAPRELMARVEKRLAAKRSCTKRAIR